MARLRKREGKGIGLRRFSSRVEAGSGSAGLCFETPGTGAPDKNRAKRGKTPKNRGETREGRLLAAFWRDFSSSTSWLKRCILPQSSTEGQKRLARAGQSRR